MAELTIKVPDALAADVRRLDAVVDRARGRAPAPTSVDLLHGLAAEGDVAREVLRVLGVGRTVSMPAGFELARSSGGLVGASAQ